MERLMIQVPEKKSALVKSLLKELGVIVKVDTTTLAKELDAMMTNGPKPTMEEIVQEVKDYRAGR